MSYIYETHLHTSEASKCGKVSGGDYIQYMIEQGYNGIIVTDHFFNGNSAVPKDLPWNERVAMYVSGYKAAKKAADEYNAGLSPERLEADRFDVFFGIEYNFNGDEYLVYGVDEEWLNANPDLLSKNRYEVHDLVSAAGGIMVQAHPYRERWYIDDIVLTPQISDGIEIYNAANGSNMNALGYIYANKLGVPMSAGSDIHFFYDGPKGGMMFERRIDSIKDYVKAFLNREGVPVLLEDGQVKKIEDVAEQTVPRHPHTYSLTIK